MEFYSYILKSLIDNKFYYGHCANLISRLKNHNAGKVRSTKGRRPLLIHYFETFPSKSEACQRELFFKSIAGYEFLRKNSII